MKHAFLLSAVATLASYTAHADVKVIDPINVTDGIPDWNQSFKKTIQTLQREKRFPAHGYMECAEIQEIGNAYICQSDTEENMNHAFMRASLFTEGGLGAPRDAVLPQSDTRVRTGINTTFGHDLKSSDLLRFYSSAQAGCQQDSQVCFNDQENEIFSSFILPLAKTTTNFAVISYSLESNTPYQETVTHEVLHARYFMEPEFRKVVDDFWANSMGEGDRRRTRFLLNDAYDTSYEYLIRNEFQAYVLMEDAEDERLGPQVSRFRGPLMNAMKAAGVRMDFINPK